METVGELVPPIRVLLGPGPSNAHPRVLKALSTPLVGHLDPEFIRLMEETKELLRFVFQTKNALTFPISGANSGGSRLPHSGENLFAPQLSRILVG